jgi:hypothetical protein
VNGFNHRLSEYCNGFKNLVFQPLVHGELEMAQVQLEMAGVAYLVCQINDSSSALFFGADACVDVIRKIGKTNLTDYSAEERLILALLLGEDPKQQCGHYLERRATEPPVKMCQCALKGKPRCTH